MFLSDQDLRKEVLERSIVESIFEDAIQPASIDVHLASLLKVFVAPIHHDSTSGLYVIDPAKDNSQAFRDVLLQDGDVLLLMPSMFVLGSLIERVNIPDDMVCRVEGVSSNGRHGLTIHSTAGWVDPGYSGNLTLEMGNITPAPILLRPRMRIAQLSFAYLSKPVLKPYSGRYQGDAKVQVGLSHV